MIRYCYIHKGIFGIKRPLLNFKKTGGICKRCFPGELEKLRKWKEEKDRRSLLLFGLGQCPSNGNSKETAEGVRYDLFGTHSKNID